MDTGVVVIDKDKATIVLVVVASLSYTPKTGPHALTMITFAQYLQQLSDPDYVVRGDGKPALHYCLRCVKDSVDPKVRLDIQKAAR